MYALTQTHGSISGIRDTGRMGAIDQNNSVSDDQNVTYWMDSFKNKWLNESVYIAWSANPSLVAMAEQTLARGRRSRYRRSLDYTTGKCGSEWIEK